MSLAGDEPGAFDGVRVPLAGQWNRVAFLASSGATIDEVLMKQVPKVPESANQITLTVGGNDVGFMTVAQACAEAPSRCQGAILAAADKLGDMGADLGLLITALKTQAPKATIFVTGYPQIFQPSLTEGCPALPLIPLDALYAADSAGDGALRRSIWPTHAVVPAALRSPATHPRDANPTPQCGAP